MDTLSAWTATKIQIASDTTGVFDRQTATWLCLIVVTGICIVIWAQSHDGNRD